MKRRVVLAEKNRGYGAERSDLAKLQLSNKVSPWFFNPADYKPGGYLFPIESLNLSSIHGPTRKRALRFRVVHPAPIVSHPT